MTFREWWETKGKLFSAMASAEDLAWAAWFAGSRGKASATRGADSPETGGGFFFPGGGEEFADELERRLREREGGAS